MNIVISILASQGVVEIVGWFGEVEGAAKYAILALSAAVISAMMVIWKERC